MTHEAEILAWLKARQHITALDALSFGCFRLAARINDLRNKGYEIQTVMEPNSNNKSKHARYFLIGASNAENNWSGTKQGCN